MLACRTGSQLLFIHHEPKLLISELFTQFAPLKLCWWWNLYCVTLSCCTLPFSAWRSDGSFSLFPAGILQCLFVLVSVAILITLILQKWNQTDNGTAHLTPLSYPSIHLSIFYHLISAQGPGGARKITTFNSRELRPLVGSDHSDVC